MSDHSINPAGERFALPDKGEYATELARLEKLAAAARAEGKEVVVVMGVGFVGAVMAAIVADTVDKKNGKPSKFVIGCQRASTRSFWKIPLLNRGQSPVKAEDPAVAPMIGRCVLEKKTLTATFNPDCLQLADVVVVDVQCDYAKSELGNLRTGDDVRLLPDVNDVPWTRECGSQVPVEPQVRDRAELHVERPDRARFVGHRLG